MARRVSKGSCSPGLDEARDLYSKHFSAGHNTLPISLAVRAPDTLTPVIAYLRLTNGASTNKSSFLLESVLPGSTQGRYSFVGCDPKDIIHAEAGSQDPLVSLEKTLSSYSLIPTSPSSTHLSPPFKGGAVGYVGYDCIYAFERVLKAHRPKKDDLNIPDAYFIISDAIVVFDHLFGSVSIWSHLRIESLDQLDAEYAATTARMQDVARRLATNELQLPKQPPIAESAPREAVSNVGKPGYTGFVRKLRDEHILNGDIIQAVPSQRLSRKTELHPFNAYRHLRQVNPSPYMFYIDCVVPSSSGTSQGGPTSSLQLVGASPECLLSINPDRFVTNHAIAGTIKRGVTPAQDAEMAEILLSSIKDRAEHVMLVDLARNDINRVCKPRTVHVKELMQVQRFSHVMHLTSTVEGQLRDGQTRYDAFRSIFPAGTVSGAPKIKAMELIASLEPSTRGVYAGAVGRWNFGTNADTQECDTCIAIRTMLFKDGTVYLQAGGGIVWDSEEEAEYQETVDKLGANVRTLQQAEELYAEESDEMHNVDAEST